MGHKLFSKDENQEVWQIRVLKYRPSLRGLNNNNNQYRQQSVRIHAWRNQETTNGSQRFLN